MGNNLRVDMGERKRNASKNTVFVGNLHYDVTDDELRNFFFLCGPIVRVRIIRDKLERKGKGFGYV